MSEHETQRRLDDFIQRCKSRKLSVTHQRLAIYHTLLNSPDHPSAEAIFNLIRPQYPMISLATVYKTLETLEREKMIRKVSFPHQSVARYDANLDRHHHLVCVKCHSVVDFYDDQLDNLRFKKRRARGFQLLDHSVQIHGICPSCQKR
jgi:Fur family peroxide stress response transcriptional regulator